MSPRRTTRTAISKTLTTEQDASEEHRIPRQSIRGTDGHSGPSWALCPRWGNSGSWSKRTTAQVRQTLFCVRTYCGFLFVCLLFTSKNFIGPAHGPAARPGGQGSTQKLSEHTVTPQSDPLTIITAGRREGCPSDVQTGQIFINKHLLKTTTRTHPYTQSTKRQVNGWGRPEATILTGQGTWMGGGSR